MRATVMFGAGDVRVENVPDAHLVGRPTRSSASPVPRSAAATCGRTSRWSTTEHGRRMGHEFIGIVEAVGAEVRTVKTGDLVVCAVPVVRRHLRLLPRGTPERLPPRRQVRLADVDGGQGEAVRVPQADGTLVALPGRPRRRADAVSAHALGRDGHRPPRRHRRHGRARQDRRRHRRRGRRPLRRDRRAATRRRADHPARPSPGPHRARAGVRRHRRRRASAATRRSSASASSPAASAPTRCSSASDSSSRIDTAIGIARPGGAVGRVGVPQEGSTPDAVPRSSEERHHRRRPGARPAPTSTSCSRTSSRARIEPGRVFDRIATLDEVPDGYRAMNDREAIKVMIEL